MSSRAEGCAKALSLVIVFAMVAAGLLTVAMILAPPARAGPCDQAGGVITGNWVITTPQQCSGISYTVDGNVYILPGGSLTLTDGGLSFAEDTGTAHRYGLWVNATASLTLINSTVTTQTNLISPYLKLNVFVNGTLSLSRGSVMRFPGTLNLLAGSTFNMTNSRLTGFSAVPTGVNADRLSPAIRLTGANAKAYLFGSRVESLLASTATQNITLSSGAAFYAYDTYLDVNFNTAATHSEMDLAASNAYLYNVTVNTTNAPPLTQMLPAFVPDASSSVYLFRWAHVTVLDATGVPVPGASLWSRLSPSAQTATYPDAGPTATTPTSATRWYAIQTYADASTWNMTNAQGMAVLPLWTDRITQASLPNANSFGSYSEAATYGTFSPATGGVDFPPYPSLAISDNNQYATVRFGSSIICTSTVTTWSGTVTVSGPMSVGGTLRITGTTTLVDATLSIGQQANACGYIEIASGATLNVVSSSISSNYPLVIDVTAGGHLVSSQSSVLVLTQAGIPGLLRSEGTASVSLTDTYVAGNVSLLGASATLVRVTLGGPQLAITTTSTTRIWDALLPGVTDLELGSALGLSTVAFDIRNVTFDGTQTAQLRFGHDQYVQLTNVFLDDPSNTWYLTMLTDNAVVSRYWWLTVNDVDGTGTLLAEANATIYLWRIDPVTTRQLAVPTAAPGDVYRTTSTSNPFQAPDGLIVYRAFQGTWTATSQFLNNTYVANGSASPQGSVYNSDASGQVVVTASVALQLTFTSLTPDLTVSLLDVSGLNQFSLSQPLNTNVSLIATIHNAGQINVKSVVVAFYSTNVDANNDGYMDTGPSGFVFSLIAQVVLPTVQKDSTAVATAYWNPTGGATTSSTISVVVDPPISSPTDGGAIRETNEANNILTKTVTLFTWPNLSVSSADVVPLTDPVVSNAVPLQVTIRNFGTNTATGAWLQLFEGGQAISAQISFTVSVSGTANQVVNWNPSTVGVHFLVVLVSTKNDTVQNKDYNMANNVAAFSLTVHTQPDLAVFAGDYPTNLSQPQDTSFPFVVRAHNLGETAAVNTSVAIYLDGNRSLLLGREDGITVLAGSETNVTVTVQGISTAGLHTLTIIVDPFDLLHEGDETNNLANVPLTVNPPAGNILIGTPGSTNVYQPAETIHVSGYVRDNDLDGIAGVPLTIHLLTSNNVEVLRRVTNSTTDGSFGADVPLAGLSDGIYRIRINSTSSQLKEGIVDFTVKANVPFLDSLVPLIGIPWWMFVIILAAVAAAIIGVTVYFKVYGLGKMVECGECGAFIPEDSTVCPKCGVEFEKDMAKCSNCQAWIPVDVKQCPECGVEFATGQVEMADYQEKMRLQYDEVVQKFKEDASRQLGRALSDKEFQEWWRKQPTFVTFEDWLREEEEMRKMGSKPCPVCGTLNSVTATVCHKCGSLMKQEAPRPPTGGGGAGGPTSPARKPGSVPAAGSSPAARPPTAVAQAPPSAAAPEGEAVPRRVIRRPVAVPQPVIQKKVIKRPATEGQQAETTEAEPQESEDEAKEDEL